MVLDRLVGGKTWQVDPGEQEKKSRSGASELVFPSHTRARPSLAGFHDHIIKRRRQIYGCAGPEAKLILVHLRPPFGQLAALNGQTAPLSKPAQ